MQSVVIATHRGGSRNQTTKVMKKSTKHAIENLANELNLEGKHITLVLRKEENAIVERPNAFNLTRGKNGWTACEQSSYYFLLSHLVGYDGVYILKDDFNGDIPNGKGEYQTGSFYKIDYREYTDDEILEIIESIKKNGVESLSEFGGWYCAK